MSIREVEPRSVISDSSSTSYPHPPTTSAPDNNSSATIHPTTTHVLDIGTFVEKYNRLLELLYHVSLVWNTSLYVIRWENYILTLSILLVLCVLFYYPALLAGSLVALAILGMAVGRYYSQTTTLLRRREKPLVKYADEDTYILKRYRKEEKKAHELLLDYKQIISNVERYISLVSKTLEYLYKIILWKSLEVSLCVTVLLCVLFCLLCTVYLRVLLASLPLLILCFNKYFFKRTVEIWKTLFSYVYRKVQLKRRRVKVETQKVEVVFHEQQPALLDHHSLESIPPPNTTKSEDVWTTAVTGAQESVATPEVNGTIPFGDREGVWGSSKDSSSSKGFCNKCSTSFAKLLKRKHDCNYCGQSYCGSCTVKVKRAVLGATSPAAFEESVRVCLDCKVKLDHLKLDENSIPIS